MKIKICGITRLEDAQVAIAAGATLLGFNFYPRSPRYLSSAAARAIIEQLPPAIAKVGVFVNLPPAEVDAIARAAGLTQVQLHGHEPAGDFAALAAWQPIRVLALRTPADLAQVPALPAAGLLIDTPTVDYGGSGRTGDWALARQAAALRPLFLAGGLRPENVAAAVHAVRPDGVDVSSGVETSPGVKDHARVRAFVAAALAAAAGS